MNKENYGVHIAHCCYIHGCKYGDENCPVASGEVAQKHLCYDCEEECEPYTLEEIELLRKTKSYRPTYEQLKNRIADLEAKLAESENKILELQEQSIRDNQIYNEELAEKEKEIKQLNNRILFSQLQAPKEQILNILGSQCIQYNPDQDKISFAVEHLEKVKENILSNITFGIESVGIMNSIDNQIKQLKGEK